jgi:protocatechuate 3,4-dioxygenase, alpha subunit
MAELSCTPGQTVGPFFGLAFPRPGDSDLVGGDDPDAIRLHGTVYDGAGAAVPDAVIELWQPDGKGRIPQRPGSLRRDGVTFTGWGRAATDVAGHYEFRTLTPGSARAGRPPFFAVTVFARGLLDRLFTRAYLPRDDADAGPPLAGIEPGRRATLLCSAENGSAGTDYRFDIHLQGPHETVFLTHRDPRR